MLSSPLRSSRSCHDSGNPCRAVPGLQRSHPAGNGTIAHMLREAGWSTFWSGRTQRPDRRLDHECREDRLDARGFDRFYGFIGGETNQGYPTLAEDNHYMDQPYQPEDGYHLSKDPADRALQCVRNSKQFEPDEPWYLWFFPGADHAPHHALAEHTSRSTAACSMTGTRRTGSGRCRGWASAASCLRASSYLRAPNSVVSAPCLVGVLSQEPVLFRRSW